MAAAPWLKVEFCQEQDGDGVAVLGAGPCAARSCCGLAVSMLCACIIWIGKSPGEGLSPRKTDLRAKGGRKNLGNPKAAH